MLKTKRQTLLDMLISRDTHPNIPTPFSPCFPVNIYTALYSPLTPVTVLQVCDSLYELTYFNNKLTDYYTDTQKLDKSTEDMMITQN